MLGLGTKEDDDLLTSRTGQEYYNKAQSDKTECTIPSVIENQGSRILPAENALRTAGMKQIIMIRKINDRPTIQ